MQLIEFTRYESCYGDLVGLTKLASASVESVTNLSKDGPRGPMLHGQFGKDAKNNDPIEIITKSGARYLTLLHTVEDLEGDLFG